MKKKVLMVCTQMEYGGVQIRALELQKNLRAQGWQADIVFLYKRYEIAGGNPDVKCLLIEKEKKNPFLLARSAWELLKIARSKDYSAIIGFAHYSSPLAAIVGLLSGIENRIATQTNPPYRDKFGAIPLDWLCGTLGVYTSNVAASKTIMDCFRAYPKAYRKRLKVIYNGIRVISPSIDREAARSKIGIANEDILLASCGRLSDQKNHAFLIDLMARLPKCFRLIIVGEGELRTQLAEQIDRLDLGSRVTLFGRIESNELADFLVAADVFLFPSKFEAFGLAMVEAMAVGLPVICSDYPALREVGGDAVTALSVKDEDAWIQAIISITRNPGHAFGRAELGRVRASEFSIESMCDAFRSEVLA